MDKDFLAVMAQRNDEELMKILTVHKEDYQPEAMECAEIELKKRNLSIEDLQIIKEEVLVLSQV